MKTIRYTLLLCAFLLTSVNASADTNLSLAWESDKFQAPESVLYDKRTDLLFVSNVNGSPDEKNGKGFISTVKTDGTIIQLEWVAGLHAPKGLAIVEHILYVADIDQLLEININNGRIVKRHSAPQAKFLNDVVADGQGNIYVSDMLTNTIYRLASGELTTWLHSDALEYPNGLYVQDDELIVGSWGVMTDGFSTKVPGHLKTVSLSSQTINSLGNATPVGNLDGVEPDGKGSFYVTDWLSGGLFTIDREGNATKLLPLTQGSADLDVILHKNLVLVPMMVDNKLLAYEIK